MLHVGYPLSFDHRGRTGARGYERYVRELVEQVLFTNPGERVNRPEFGCGVLQLVHAPNSDQLAAAVQVSIQSSLQRWLGELLSVEALEVEHADSTLRISLVYRLLANGQRQFETFERGGIT